MSLISNKELSWLGIRVGTSKVDDQYDVESLLIKACLDFSKDTRLPSLIFSWIKKHGNYVIVEKLAKLVEQYPEDMFPEIVWVRALAVFAVENKMHKWKKLLKKIDHKVYLYPKETTESLIKLKGIESSFKIYNFIIPCGTLRIRETDVMSVENLTKKNAQIRYRLRYGACWRADIAFAIEVLKLKNPNIISKRLKCSYEPAYRIFKEFEVLALA